MAKKIKTAKTIKEYKVKYKGWDITIPKGSIVINKTACGSDNDYHFWMDWQNQIEKLTGYKHSTLSHDLTYYGIDIPKEYCENYKD